MTYGVIHSEASKSLKHPPYFQMIRDAIVMLKERNGSSHYAIGKFIQDKHKDHLPANFNKMLLIQLKKLVAGHKLVKVKASYKLPSTAKTVAAAKPKKGAALAKKKPTAPAKTKAAPKAKPVPKAKPAAKAKLAPKAAKLTAKLVRTSTRWMPGKKASAKVAPKTSGRLITLEEDIKHFGELMEEAAGIVRASRATLKGLCRSIGASRCSYETDKSDSFNSIFKGSNEPHFTTNIVPSPATFDKHDKHIRHQQVQTNLPHELAQPETTNRNSVTLLTIKATYKEDKADNYEIILAHDAKNILKLSPWAPFWSSAIDIGLNFPIYISEVAVSEEASV